MKKNNNIEATMMLLEAATKGNEEVIAQLIDAEIDINQGIGDSGVTALMIAVINSNKLVIEALINANADVNSHDISGSTALMYAAAKNNIEIMELLINAKADINARDNRGWTALMNACDCSRYDKTLDTINLLVKAGADVNAKGKHRDSYYRGICNIEEEVTALELLFFQLNYNLTPPPFPAIPNQLPDFLNIELCNKVLSIGTQGADMNRYFDLPERIIPTFMSSSYIPRFEQLIVKIAPKINRLYHMLIFGDMRTSQDYAIPRLPLELWHLILNRMLSSLSSFRVFTDLVLVNEYVDSRIVIKANIAKMVFKPEVKYSCQLELDHA